MKRSSTWILVAGLCAGCRTADPEDRALPGIGNYVADARMSVWAAHYGSVEHSGQLDIGHKRRGADQEPVVFKPLCWVFFSWVLWGGHAFPPNPLAQFAG